MDLEIDPNCPSCGGKGTVALEGSRVTLPCGACATRFLMTHCYTCRERLDPQTAKGLEQVDGDVVMSTHLVCSLNCAAPMLAPGPTWRLAGTTTPLPQVPTETLRLRAEELRLRAFLRALRYGLTRHNEWWARECIVTALGEDVGCWKHENGETCMREANHPPPCMSYVQATQTAPVGQ